MLEVRSARKSQKYSIKLAIERPIRLSEIYLHRILTRMLINKEAQINQD